jgi:hypothetical protein
MGRCCRPRGDLPASLGRSGGPGRGATPERSRGAPGAEVVLAGMTVFANQKRNRNLTAMRSPKGGYKLYTRDTIVTVRGLGRGGDCWRTARSSAPRTAAERRSTAFLRGGRPEPRCWHRDGPAAFGGWHEACS